MTTLSPPPSYDNFWPPAQPPSRPPSRWRRLLGGRRRKVAIAGGLTVALVAGVLGASYETAPGGTLWGIEKTVFPGHAQDVALTAVVNDLKDAQNILGSGQQPTADQLTDARSSLNAAKQGLDYLATSPERTSLQNLYLQLTQELLQYTPDSAQQLPALPAPPIPDPAPPVPQAAGPGDPGDPGPVSDATLASATAPSWGYPITDQSGTVADDGYYGSPDVPYGPDASWPQPYASPLTANLADLGYYDPTWGQLYGYNPGAWYNYDLSGYNQYGYDFLGFDRWGYDRWGYDRWGYDHSGYDWSGYNRSGYDRGGWDHDGRNDWGQHRDHPGDPRDQGWYNTHHAFEQYYQSKFQHDDPVYARSQWDQAHGVNTNQYQNWNMNRDWHNPRNRDWAPPATAVSATKSAPGAKTHASEPVVNLNASLAQFVSNDKSAGDSGSLLKDLSGKSSRDFTKDLVAQTNSSAKAAPQPQGSTPGQRSTPGQHPTGTAASHDSASAPPALAAAAPTVPPSKVSPGFSAPKLAPVPLAAPPAAGKGQGTQKSPASGVKSGTTPGLTGADPKAGTPDAGNPKSKNSPDPAVGRPDAPAATPRGDDSAPAAKPSAPQDNTPKDSAPKVDAPGDVAPKGDTPKVDAPKADTSKDLAPKQEAPEQDAPKQEAPKQEAPKQEAPKQEAPKQEAPKQEAPKQEAPKQEAPRQEAPRQEAPKQDAPVHQAPPVQHSAPAPVQHAAPPPAQHAAPAPRPAPAPAARPAPAPHAAPSCSSPKCKP